MRTALVTGASRGIGAAIARTLDRSGAQVALAGRDERSLEQVAGELTNSPVVCPVDLSELGGPTLLAEQALASLGHVDVLVNNAGIAWRGHTHEMTGELAQSILDVNLRSPLVLIAALVPGMVARGVGCIINITSISGVVGTPHRAVYAASKGGLDAATRSLAIELGPHGIRVNAVAPGVVDTDLWASNRAVPGVTETIERQIPLRRWSTTDDVADVVDFLASDKARYITGETLRADGGLASTRDLYSGASERSVHR